MKPEEPRDRPDWLDICITGTTALAIGLIILVVCMFSVNWRIVAQAIVDRDKPVPSNITSNKFEEFHQVPGYKILPNKTKEQYEKEDSK